MAPEMYGRIMVREGAGSRIFTSHLTVNVIRPQIWNKGKQLRTIGKQIGTKRQPLWNELFLITFSLLVIERKMKKKYMILLGALSLASSTFAETWIWYPGDLRNLVRQPNE